MVQRFPVSTQSVLFTIFGDYIYSPKLQSSIWAGSLIHLLQEFGYSEQAVRLVLSRMYMNGWLERNKKGVKSYYSMSEKSLQLMIDSEKRIFRKPADKKTWNGQWFLVTHIPNGYADNREVRDELRKELKWLGFGTLSTNVWMSPYDYGNEVCQIAKRLRTSDTIEYFFATHNGFGSNKTLVTKCWDLSKANENYRQFLEQYSSRLDDIKALLESGKLPDNRCFVERVMLVNEYRKFPFSDPWLPEELLPPDWLGGKTTRLFTELHDLLAPGAHRFFMDEISH
jgi:phenylacetic acid degradation operon negative regulatory protein